MLSAYSARNLLNVSSLRATSCLFNKRNATTSVPPEKDPANLRSKWPKPSFSIDKMQELLDHDNLEMRKEFRAFLSDPVFKPKYNIPLEEEREVRANIFLKNET